MSRDMEAQLADPHARDPPPRQGRVQHQLPGPAPRGALRPAGPAEREEDGQDAAASTAEDVLEELALVHELPRKILEYRSVQKLKSTYVDALPELVHPETGRIHATFNQTVAATGRLSATDPNLQNIPIRTAEGRRIREAFVAEPGHLLLSADYSQIELRVLAHLSKDPTLIDTFRRGEDVHDRTSREIFGPLSPVPPRRAAPHLEDGQLRAPLREDRLHASPRTSASRGRRPRASSRPTSPATRRCAASSTTRSRRRARPATCARSSGACAGCPTCARRASRSAWRPSGRP